MKNSELLIKYLFLLLFALLMFVVFVYLEHQKPLLPVGESNDLDARSIQIVETLNGKEAVKFEVFIDPNSVIANKINQFFEPYLWHNPALGLEFVDPIKQPDRVQLNHITMQGEMVLSYQDQQSTKRINITELSESAIINAVMRLKNEHDEWLIFAEGFGMKTIGDQGPSGLSNVLIYLKKLGINVARVSLDPDVNLPENVKVILLPAPSEILDENTVAWLLEQQNKGISLWWMNDINGIEQTALELALEVISGDKTPLYDDEYANVLTTFPAHRITEKFNQPLFVAQAREVAMADADPIWQSDSGVVLAAASTGPNARVLVTGDADFLTNQYFNVAANRSFTERLVDWLFYRDDRINLAVSVNQDTQLFLSPSQLLWSSGLFLLLLPSVGLFMAWRHYRKAKRY